MNFKKIADTNFKAYQHEQRGELKRKTRLNLVDLHNFDRKDAL